MLTIATVYAGPAEETKTKTESSAEDIKVAIREMRENRRLVQVSDAKGHLLVEAMTHDSRDKRGHITQIVDYFVLRVRHEGELDRSRKIDGYAVWKLLSNHDYQITSKQ